MTENIQKYEKYKTSGVEWLGDVPEHWEVKRLKRIFHEIKKRSNNELNCGSISFGKVIFKDDEKIPESTKKSYQVVLKGDFLVNPLNLNYDLVSLRIALSELDVVVSSGYIVLGNSIHVNKSYFKWLLHRFDVAYMKLLGSGVRQTLNYADIGNCDLLFPPLAEQTAIAAYLDEKTTQLDTAIAQKQHMIALLKERRQILIHRAVTQGLDPSVKMKKSGVEWIGDVPEHWEVKRAKFLFDEIDERSQTGEEELLSVSHMTGVTPRSEKNVSMFMAEDYTGSKLCQKDDLIFNIMWAWMGALGISDRTGIVSPSYAIYRQKGEIFNSWYLEQLLGDTNYVAHYNRVSTGLHSSRLRFYSTMFFDMKIGFPSLEEQNRIVDFLKINVEKIDTALTLKEQEIVKLKEYKSTLINSAVTGKIRVKNEK
jgi:type I restriction enzyme, S subunit